MKFRHEYIDGCNWMVGDFYLCKDRTPGILIIERFSLFYKDLPKRTDIKKRLSFDPFFYDNEIVRILVEGTIEEIKEYYDKELKYYITEIKRIKKLQNNYKKWFNK